MSLDVVNPATGEIIETYNELTPEALDTLLDDVVSAQRAWSHTDFSHRAECLRQAARVLETRIDSLAHLMAAEMGKPLEQGRAEVEKCAWVLDHYAGNGADELATEPVETDASESFVTFQPLGIVLAVMPWNFPLWQVFRFIAPALMAGNAGVLKHAETVPGCALAIEQILRDAGFPEHLFRTLLVDKSRVAGLLEDSRIAAATLTGSTGAGRAVAAKAGEQLKKTVLELGGSDPYIVLADADVEAAAKTCAKSRLLNAGQSCIAAKRFVVVESVRDLFEECLVRAMAQAKTGDPLDPDVEVGPMARIDLRDALHEQVDGSLRAGARCLLGGVVPEGPGAYYPPTVLTDVESGMPAYEEELFGPVAAILPAKDEDDAIRIANDSVFGLGAAVFTRDVARGRQIAAERLEAGCCAVNDFVRSDPRLPFGGIKQSGYGRELSHYGIREFVNVKSVYVQ